MAELSQGNEQGCRPAEERQREAPKNSPLPAAGIKNHELPLETAQELDRGAEVALGMFGKYDKTILEQQERIKNLERENQQLRHELESCRALQESQVELKKYLQGALDKIQKLRDLFFDPDKRRSY